MSFGKNIMIRSLLSKFGLMNPFSITFMGMGGPIKYKYGKKIVYIPSALINLKNPTIEIDAYSIWHWEPPYYDIQISKEEKEDIVEAVSRWLKQLKFNVRVNRERC